MWFWIIACLLSLTGCTKHIKPQSLRLDNNTTISLKDAWVLDHAPKMLQVLLVYDGLDPNETYHLRAALRDTADGNDGPQSWIKQYPTAGKATNQIEVVWEFTNFPRESQNIYLRLYYADKQSGQQNGKLEFVVPGVADLPLRKL